MSRTRNSQSSVCFCRPSYIWLSLPQWLAIIYNKATNQKHCYVTSRYFTLEGFHMCHRQSEYGKFVWFSSKRATCGNHVTHLIYICGHLATSTPFNLTMALPITKIGPEPVMNQEGKHQRFWELGFGITPVFRRPRLDREAPITPHQLAV